MSHLEWFLLGVFTLGAAEALFVVGMVSGQKIVGAGKQKAPPTKEG